MTIAELNEKRIRKSEEKKMDGYYMKECFGLPEDFECEVCPHNVGAQTGYAGVVGPCGQQNCWYSCTVCEYNGMNDCDE